MIRDNRSVIVKQSHQRLATVVHPSGPNHTFMFSYLFSNVINIKYKLLVWNKKERQF